MSPNHLSNQEYNFAEIAELYNHAEELLSTVESSFVAEPEKQFEIVEPLVTQLGDSADILAEIFSDTVRNPETPQAPARRKAEMALRKLFVALEHYAKQVRRVHEGRVVALHNIADPIVLRIRRQLESVVAIFMELLNISVHLIMNKQEIEQLKQHDARVAAMLSPHSQQHS